MNHLPNLISDLALILITAGVVTVLAQKLKQPVVLGYLIAGALVGRSASFFPNIEDATSIQVWADIGVIFLLFGLGLEYSYSKFAEYGKTASITALVEVPTMLVFGFLTGRLMGWSSWDSLFLGGMVAIASTSIVVRAFEEMKLKNKIFAQATLGILVFEDLFAIILLVAFAALGASKGGNSWSWLSIVPYLGFFLILAFTLGTYLIPQIFARWRRELNQETVLVFSIGLCLALVVVANKAGFSPALGAFLMGSILGGTSEGPRIEKLLHPIRDLFAAVFFVSVGMLIEPKQIVEHAGSILIIFAVLLVAKSCAVTLGSLIAGQTVKDSIRSGMSLAQIGEFSFLIAGLGAQLHHLSPFLYPIIVGVAVLSTFSTPYMIRASTPVANWLESRLSPDLLGRLNEYRQAMQSNSTNSLLTLLRQAVGFAPVVNTVLVMATILAMRHWVLPLTSPYIPLAMRPYVFSLGTLALVAPFLWGIMQSRIHAHDERTWQELRGLFFGVLLARALMTLLLVFFVFATFVSDTIPSLILITTVFLGLFFGRRWLEPAYQRFERKFLQNLQTETATPGEAMRAASLLAAPIAPWDVKLKKVMVSSDSPFAGKSLLAANLRENVGVTVTRIERGSRQIMPPGGDELILPGDTLYLIGAEDVLDEAQAVFEFLQEEQELLEDIGLSPLRLRQPSHLIGRSVRDSGLRESTHGIIVGIERGSARILNPDSTFVLESNDLLWIVGRRDLIRKLDHTNLTEAYP